MSDQDERVKSITKKAEKKVEEVQSRLQTTID
jgi:hypothetical protein